MLECLNISRFVSKHIHKCQTFSLHLRLALSELFLLQVSLHQIVCLCSCCKEIHSLYLSFLCDISEKQLLSKSLNLYNTTTIHLHLVCVGFPPYIAQCCH